MRFKGDLILLFVALIWGFAFAAQRSAANTIGIWWFNGARFLLAGIFLMPFLLYRKPNFPKKELSLIVLTSAVLTLASSLQQAGLKYTSAANAGFITSMYVVLVPILSVVLFRRIIPISVWLSAILAVIGALFLSTGLQNFTIAIGDLLEFIGAILWALHIILIDKVIQKKVDILLFAVMQYSIVAFIQLGIGFTFEVISIDSLMKAGIAIAYTGIVSAGIGYTLQIYGQKFAPPADAAIILSMESVFAALGGFIILREALLPIQILGCVLIFAAVIWSQKSKITDPQQV